MTDHAAFAREHAARYLPDLNSKTDTITPLSREGTSKRDSGNAESQNDVRARSRSIRQRLVSLNDVSPILTTNYLVKGWLQRQGLSILYGPSNVGKTFIALDLAVHIAAGVDWFDCRVQPGPVVYVAAEGGNGIKNRLAAIVQERPEFRSAQFYLLPVRLDFNGDLDPAALAGAIGTVKPSLVVIDTLARSMGDGNENNTADMNRFVAAVDKVRELTQSHVLIVHHTGKDEERGARGSNALRAAADSEIYVTSEGEIRCTKQRDFVTPKSLFVTLRSVTLGDDEDGDPVSSAVVENTEAKPAKRRPLTGKNQVAMNALAEALNDHGERYLNSDCYPNNTDIVEVSHWKAACQKHGLTSGGSDSAARTAFKRAKDALMEMNAIREYNDHVWRVFDDH